MLFEELGRQLREYPGRKRLGTGAKRADISSAESNLGAKLPESYKVFLGEFGWGGVDSWELFGLGAGVPNYLDLVQMTETERTLFHPHIPPFLIPIMNDGFGNHYCLDTSSLRDGECPVVLWDHEKGARQVPGLVSPRFDLWLLDILRADPTATG
jgi:cell wall assembly regulator SMI1